MTGQRCLHRDLRGFLITNFTDENDVRVMAQDRAQAARECKAGFFIDLDLIDAFELILDRVFNGDDFAL